MFHSITISFVYYYLSDFHLKNDCSFYFSYQERCENYKIGYIEGDFIQLNDSPSNEDCEDQVYHSSLNATGMSRSTNIYNSCYAHFGIYMNNDSGRNDSDVGYISCLFYGNFQCM